MIFSSRVDVPPEAHTKKVKQSVNLIMPMQRSGGFAETSGRGRTDAVLSVPRQAVPE